MYLHEVRTSRFNDGNSIDGILNPQILPIDREVRFSNDPICSRNSWAYFGVISKAAKD